MNDAIGLAEALLGSDGFRVLEVADTPAEVEITVETTAQIVSCTSCGVRAQAHDRLRVDIRDLPCFGPPTRLVWLKEGGAVWSRIVTPRPGPKLPVRCRLGPCAWLAQESVRDVYLTDDLADATILLDKAITGCKNDQIEEIRSLGNTLSRWRTEILNHHRTGASNGPTEGLNLCVKKVKRAGRGFKCFKHYRLRVLLHAGSVTWLRISLDFVHPLRRFRTPA